MRARLLFNGMSIKFQTGRAVTGYNNYNNLTQKIDTGFGGVSVCVCASRAYLIHAAVSFCTHFDICPMFFYT